MSLKDFEALLDDLESNLTYEVRLLYEDYVSEADKNFAADQTKAVRNRILHAYSDATD